MSEEDRRPIDPADGAADAAAPEQAEAPAEGAETPETQPAPEPDLAEQLAAAQSQAQEYLQMAQRARADYENLSRRTQTVRSESYEDGRRSVAAAMLPVLDNLERAMNATGEESALRSGVELTLKQMQDVFTRMNVTAIDRPGEVFDPNLENAVMQAPPEEGEPGTVAQVLQKGYRMGDFVLRHAMVKVVAG